MDRQQTKAFAESIRDNALVGVSPQGIMPNSAGITDAREDDPVSAQLVIDLAEKITTQDNWWKSKRVHTAVAALIAVGAGIIGTSVDESQIAEALSTAAFIATIVLPLWSKASDKRATKQKK